MCVAAKCGDGIVQVPVSTDASFDADGARAIAIRLEAGQELRDHQVRERVERPVARGWEAARLPTYPALPPLN